MYSVVINKKERADIRITSEDSVSMSIWGGANFSKDHGYTTLSYDGVCSLIGTLLRVKEEMEKGETVFF